MRIDETVDFGAYGARLASLLLAMVATRYTAGGDLLPGAPAWIALFAACWVAGRALRAPGRKPGLTPQQAGEGVAALGMALFLVALLREGILPALVALVFALQAALLVVGERRGHVLLAIGAGLTVVFFAAAQSRSGWFVPCAAWFTIAALALLAADHGAARAAKAVAVVAGQPAGTRGGALVALVALAVALPLYLFVPQPQPLQLGGRVAQSSQDYNEAPGSDGPQRDAADDDAGDDARDAGDAPSRGHDGPDPVPDYGDEFAIDGVERRRALGNGIVMYVRSSARVYLRGKLFERYESDRWRRAPGGRTTTALVSGYWEGPGAREPDVVQTIDVVAPLDASVYASPGVTRMRFPAPAVYRFDDGTFALPRALRPPTTYSVEAAVDVAQGRYAVDGAPPGADARALPRGTSRRIVELAREVAGPGDAAAKARALETHLRSQYAYSFETVVPYQGRTPLDWFLFEHKRGHCEFFASAMVVMLRAVDVPARLVTGFSLGERNPLTGYHEVRALDAHAWAEAWIDGRWTMYEPTPFYPLPDPHRTDQVAAATDEYLERQASIEDALDPGSASAALKGAARDAWALLRHLQRRALAALDEALPWLPLAIAVVALAFPAVRLVRAALADASERRRARRFAADARRGGSVLAAASALETALASRGAPRAAHATFREWSAALAVPAGLADAFDDARYGALQRACPGECDAVATLVERELGARPWPRVAALVEGWIAAARALVASARRR